MQAAIGFLRRYGIRTFQQSRRRVPRPRRDGHVSYRLMGKPLALLPLPIWVPRNTHEAPIALRHEGSRNVMLTGDNRATADAVACQLGIDGVEAKGGPEDKVQGI